MNERRRAVLKTGRNAAFAVSFILLCLGGEIIPGFGPMVPDDTHPYRTTVNHGKVRYVSDYQLRWIAVTMWAFAGAIVTGCVLHFAAASRDK